MEGEEGRKVVEAPAAPAEHTLVLQTGRGAGTSPPDTDFAGVKAAELLSSFFDSREPGDGKGCEEEASQGSLEATAAAARAALGGVALEYLVLRAEPFAHLREAPSASAASVGRLKCGTIVSGFPAGRWLRIDKEEAERRRVERRNAWSSPAPDSGAWVPLQGPSSRLIPRWAALAVSGGNSGEDAIELTWPGLPAGVGAEYTVCYRPRASPGAAPAAAPAAVAVAAGPQPRASLGPGARAAMEARVCARLRLPSDKEGTGAGALVELEGEWTDLGAAQQEQQARQMEEEAAFRRQQEAAGETTALQTKDRVGARVVNGRGRGVFGTMLLPGKYAGVSCRTISDASMWQVAATPINIPQGIADFPEEARYRVMITDSRPRIFLLEMNAVASFNMMDSDLSAEVINAMETCLDILKMPTMLKNPPLAYTVQGSGPHFCPGGNPNWQWRPGFTAISVNQYTGYLGFVQIRELCMPGVAAVHGSMVGGGVAYSLNCSERIGTSTLSVSYGNLSRGAVPGMMLSKNVTQTLGLAGAIDLYLTDGTLSSYAAVKGKFLTKLLPGNTALKAEGINIAKRLAGSVYSHRVPNLRPQLDVQRFATEIIGISLSGKSGVLFANVKAKGKKAEAQEEQKQLEVQQEQQEWQQEEWRPRPKRRPKRRARRQ